MVYVTTFLGVSTTLFLIGILGIVLNRKNILIILMSVELMLLAVNINFVVFSVYLDDLIGQMFALFILTKFEHSILDFPVVITSSTIKTLVSCLILKSLRN